MSTQPPKAPSAWERYRDRPAARPKIHNGERISTMSDMAQEQDKLMADVKLMLSDHAHHIDTLKQQLKDMQGFMEWATTTHPMIFAEYKAVGDLVEVSGGGKKLDKLLKEWGAE